MHDARTLKFINSWGRDWGDDGAGYISEEYFERHVDSVIVVRPSYTGAAPAMIPRLMAEHWEAGRPRAFNPQVWARSWGEPNPRLMGTLVINGTKYERFRRPVFSLAAREQPVHIFDLVDRGRGIGRFHLVEPDDEGNAVLQELWIDPTRRRQGFGSALEDQATRLARSLGASRIIAPLFEADARPQNRDVADVFARRRAYRWKPAEGRRPIVICRAEKHLDGG